ncbi:hypothetical protein EYC84_004176 [Monilinia fructicola]|uniref:Uncharacterized protein n=1 Tax=Monilinia fructicola TaxID=38448 RepID=A0A5M9JZH3_MONFR|nr:hypothetical protein EYC84_004176 [Monilinia fructicola]
MLCISSLYECHIFRYVVHIRKASLSSLELAEQSMSITFPGVWDPIPASAMVLLPQKLFDWHIVFGSSWW